MSSLEMPRKEVPPPLELVKSRIEEVLPPDAKRAVDGGEVVLVDVRDPDRFELGRIEGAVNVPSGQNAAGAHDAGYVAALKEAAGGDGRLILYCGEGNRSARTVDALRNEHGIEDAVSIVGGIKLWRDLGYPIEGELADEHEDQENQL
jgi:adenylyltransferase/sulfurtransferase